MTTATRSRSSGAHTRARSLDRTRAYAQAVVDGAVVTGRAVRLACQRHLDDVAHAATRGLTWRVDLAERAIDFFPAVLRLHEGQFADQPFRLEPWQQFIVGSLFGWLGADGFRRFRVAYVEAGKGNGKSPLAGGLGLYGMTEDDEPSAGIYSAATQRLQARILWLDAKRMCQSSPALTRRLDILEHSLFDRTTGSSFLPVSAEAKGLEGIRVHMGLIDEIWAHADADVIQAIRRGTKGRRQALIVEITNSGSDRASICWQHHEYSLRVLEGIEANDTWFAYVCQLDPCEACRTKGFSQPQEGCAACDDWRDEATWVKANPNLDVSVTRKYLRERVAEAVGMPAAQNETRRSNFCAWTEAITRWFSPEKWALGAAAVDLASLRGRRCVVGVDMAQTTDLAAIVAIFPDDDFFVTAASDVRRADDVREAGPAPPSVQGGLDVVSWFFVPEISIVERARRDRVPYDVWRDQGYLEATPGDTIDTTRMRRVVRELRDVHGFDVTRVCYDRAYARDFAQALQDEDGFEVEPVVQSMAELNEPSVLLEVLVRTGRIRHGNHPVLRWCAANVVKDTDAGGRIKPSKAKSTERMDGISALVTGLRWVTAAKTSVYTSRGLLTI
jgi:phage terminase large subunit-like protein